MIVFTILTHRWHCPACDAWGLVEGDIEGESMRAGVMEKANQSHNAECGGTLEIAPVLNSSLDNSLEPAQTND